MGFRVNANGTVDSNPDVADLTAARMNDTKHTPTPWRVTPGSGLRLLIDVEGSPTLTACTIAAVQPEDDNGEAIREAQANAAHIVKCVNAHDELVAALRSLSDLSRAYIGHMDMDDLAALEAARTILAKVSK